ncbi:MAG: PhoU domain-containing protein [Planctomycetota bacterium]
MFEWLKRLGGDSRRLEAILARFNQMLLDGRHMFDLAANALLGGTDIDVIRQDLFKSDERINAFEQKLRRRLIVHAAVHGSAEFPTCLVLMSIAKDAERIGDYCKNIFDLAASRRLSPEHGRHADLLSTKDKISRQLAMMIKVYSAQDPEGALDLLMEAESLQDFCDKQIHTLISGESDGAEDVISALAFRYFKRITAHSKNIVSSIVMPVDKLDYIPEDDD